ncbi:MAG: response regulator [Clostridiales bacterium]
MSIKEKLNNIIEEGRKIFAKEQSEKINSAMKSLLKHSINNNMEEKTELKRFFHSLKGAGASFKLYDIAELGKEYELYIDSIKDYNQMNDSYFIKILKGLALANNLIEKLNTEYLEEVNIENHKYDREKLLSTYITKTKSPVILIIDDDLSILSQMKLVLDELNYEIITSPTLEEYKDLIFDNKVDFILMDIMLKNSNGLDFLRKLRKSGLNIPIILITSDTDTNIKLKAYESGAEDYITKPFDFKELQIRVQRVINNSQKSKSLIYTDILTQAYSKTLLDENIKIAQYRLKKYNEPCSICLIDIDSFNHINTIFGYENGDKVLTKFVTEINLYFKNKEQIYRNDEDSFIVLLPNTNMTKTYSLIKKIRNDFSKREFFSDGINSVNLIFSAGIAIIDSETEFVLDIIKRAGTELKKAKAIGRSSIFPNNLDDININELKKKVLIIDDMNSIIYLLKKQLNELGFSVDFATDGEKGLMKASKYEPDIILLDLMLPKISGIEVLKTIKSKYTHLNTKIIIITSNRDKDTMDMCLKNGADSFITKPISLIELQSVITKLFEM